MPPQAHLLALALPGFADTSRASRGGQHGASTMRLFALALALVVAQPALARNLHHYRHPIAVTANVATPPDQAMALAPSLAYTPQPDTGRDAYAAMVSRHAQANGVPESLVHRVIVRESNYHPGAVSQGNYG